MIKKIGPKMARISRSKKKNESTSTFTRNKGLRPFLLDWGVVDFPISKVC